MRLRPPRSTRTDTLVPYATLCRSASRAAMRRLAATVTVISTRADDGIRHGMTATAVTSVSADPPAVLACVNRSAALHAQLHLGPLFCINLLQIGRASWRERVCQ